MREVLSISLNDTEQEMLNSISRLYDCGRSAIIKQLAFERMEDLFDLKVIEEYEKKKSKGKIKLHSHEDVFGDLD